MFLKSKGWMLIAAIGHGVLLSLALTGGVRLACFLMGMPLSSSAAGNLFLAGSLVAGGASASLYGRRLRAITPPPAVKLDQHFLV